MSAIGGYFELELKQGRRPHPNAIALNSGKNCLQFLLEHRHYAKVYVPIFTCDVVYKPFETLHIPYELYGINWNLEPLVLPELNPDEAFLYTNYFGLKQDCVERLAKKYGNQLIVDNAQAYYAKPIKGVNTYYSPRKFLGVPDGGYLYMSDNKKCMYNDLLQSTSYNRIGHLVKRIDLSAEEAYAEFKAEDESLANEPIMRMSKLTSAMLSSVNNDLVRTRRRENYLYLHKQLFGFNKLMLALLENSIPMVYPLYVENAEELRKKFAAGRIYCAAYWPNLFADCDEKSIEYQLAKNVIHLPIDQRYREEDMNQIINVVSANCTIINKNNSIRGGGVRIRPLSHDDALTSYKWRNDREVFRFTGAVYSQEITPEMEAAWIDKVVLRNQDYRCAIDVNGIYVGNIYLTDIDAECGEYQIFIGEKEYWGKGIARAASELILKYAFVEKELKYVWLNVRDDNERAVQLYKSLGFVQEGEHDHWIRMVKRNINKDI